MGLTEDLRHKFNEMIGTDRRFSNPNQMSEELGIDYKSLTRFLKGNGGISMDSLEKAFEALNVKVIFSGEEKPMPLHTPEGRRIDEVIAGMRQIGLRPEAIRDAVIRELEGMFEKKSQSEEDEERRLAG